MTIYITEAEMLDRYVQGLQQAADRCIEIIKADEKDKPELFVEFLNGIKVAAGSSHQLAHSRPDQSPQWLDLRNLLENILEAGKELPLMTNKQNGLWMNIRNSLKTLTEKGKKVAFSRGMSRTDVLFDMDLRMKNSPNLVGSPVG